MNSPWIICMSVFGFLLIFISVINYHNCKREYKNILQLTQPNNPQTNIISNQIYPMPVAYGVEVYNENENIITINLS